MELKKGYKQSESGVLPDDWRIFCVRELIDLLTDYDANGSFSSVAENVKSYDFEEYAWYVRSTDLEKNTSMNKVKYVDKASYKFLKKTALYGGELLFLKRGDIGNVYLFEMKTERATVAPNLYLLKLNNISNSQYLYYYFTSIPGNKQLKSKNASSTLGALYKDDVKNILVPLPPTKAEQTAIANALSDIDDLINSLSTLIEKKKAIKQGAMQELMKPKEGWVSKKLGEIADVTKLAGFEYTNYFNSYMDGGEIVVVRGTNITHNKMDLTDAKYIPRTTSNFLQRSKLKKDDLVFAYVGTIGPIFLIDENDKYHLGPNTSKITSGSLLLPIFLFHYFTSSQIKNEIVNNTSIGAQPSLSMFKIRSFNVLLPPIKEQYNIATILSDMNNEITSLEKNLFKYQMLKQGMMQVLLTGKIRLI